MNTIDIPIEIAKSDGVTFISIRCMIKVLIEHNKGITNLSGLSSTNKGAVSDMLLTLIRMLKHIDDPLNMKLDKPTLPDTNHIKAIENDKDDLSFLDI